MRLIESGYDSFRTSIGRSDLLELREDVFGKGEAGVRCLLDVPVVRGVAVRLRENLAAAGLVPQHAVAIQAIAFDKNPDANWKVTWHQDVMFPFAQPATQRGFEMRCKKEGVDYARPPREVLEELLAVRLHVDDCDELNGPLRVSPGSHRHGIFRSSEIPERITKHGEAVCVASAGDALLMKPLLLHASSPAREPKHRRVLHIVFHSGTPMPEKWFRAV